MYVRKRLTMATAVMALGAGLVAVTPAQAAPASTTSTWYMSGKSLGGNTRISGTYRYHVTGYTDKGSKIYGGSFSNAGARDVIRGNGLEAVLALSYYSWSGGAWHYSPRHAVKVNSFGSWTFKNKKDVYGYACDRKVGTKKLINCKRSW